jgi:hypothetical protein
MTSHPTGAEPVYAVGRAQETRPRRRGPKWDPQFTGRYFTQGSNLYRLVEGLTPAGNVKLATMEDCRTLGLLLVSGDYLTKASLRPVP